MRRAPARLILRWGLIVAAGLAGLAAASFVGPAPAGAAVTAVPHCPPDCGAVTAGDPLLVPFMTVNPGPGWEAVPASSLQHYVSALQGNLHRGPDADVASNVAAAQWQWVTGRYGLMIVLVSSPSLGALGFGEPVQNLQFLCGADRGVLREPLTSIPGVAHSATALCSYPAHSAIKGATVATFRRGDVTALVQITSRVDHAIDPRTTAAVVRGQFGNLPAGGVPVSRGTDPQLLLLWLVLLGAGAYAALSCARRRGTWRGPVDAVAEACGRRWVALAVAALGIVGAMVVTMTEWSVLHGSGGWYAVSGATDLWQNWGDAARLTHGGGLGHLYTLDPTLETAPAFQVLIAPVAALASGLSYPNPSFVVYPGAFWVAGPVFLAGMALPICAGDRCLEVMGVTGLGRRLVVLGAMAVTLPAIAIDGHPEDLFALGAMLYGLLAAVERRPLAVGWWLGFALAFQFFAFLAVPLALVLLVRQTWWRAIIPMVAVPLVFLVVPLVADPSTTVHELVHQRVYFDMGYVTPTWKLDPGVGAFLRAAVALLAVPAALVFARYRPKGRGRTVGLLVWIVASLFALRVFEPELVPYFLAPTVALLPVSAAHRPWWRLGLTVALAVWLTWWLHVAIHERWSLWLLLLGQLAVVCWLGFPRVRRAAARRAPQAAAVPEERPLPSTRLAKA